MSLGLLSFLVFLCNFLNRFTAFWANPCELPATCITTFQWYSWPLFACSLDVIEGYSKSAMVLMLPCCTSVELSAYDGQCNKGLSNAEVLPRCWHPDDQSMNNFFFWASDRYYLSVQLPFEMSSLIIPHPLLLRDMSDRDILSFQQQRFPLFSTHLIETESDKL